jgi:hypothetical protein
MRTHVVEGYAVLQPGVCEGGAAQAAGEAVKSATLPA